LRLAVLVSLALGMNCGALFLAPVLPSQDAVASEGLPPSTASPEWELTCGFKRFDWGEAAMHSDGISCRRAWRLVDPVTRDQNSFDGHLRNWVHREGKWRCQEPHPTFVQCTRGKLTVSWGISSGD